MCVCLCVCFSLSLSLSLSLSRGNGGVSLTRPLSALWRFLHSSWRTQACIISSEDRETIDHALAQSATQLKVCRDTCVCVCLSLSLSLSLSLCVCVIGVLTAVPLLPPELRISLQSRRHEVQGGFANLLNFSKVSQTHRHTQTQTHTDTHTHIHTHAHTYTRTQHLCSPTWHLRSRADEQRRMQPLLLPQLLGNATVVCTPETLNSPSVPFEMRLAHTESDRQLKSIQVCGSVGVWQGDGRGGSVL